VTFWYKSSRGVSERWLSDLDTKEELRRLNSKLDPLMMRYQGMGVHHKKGYAILSMGGENGWTAAENEKKYTAVGDKHEFKSLDDLLESIDKKPWQEIGFQEEFTGGFRQEVRQVYPGGELSNSNAVESSSVESESSLDEVNDMDDFIDPLKEY